jgi:hypothetical protein
MADMHLDPVLVEYRTWAMKQIDDILQRSMDMPLSVTHALLLLECNAWNDGHVFFSRHRLDGIHKYMDLLIRTATNEPTDATALTLYRIMVIGGRTKQVSNPVCMICGDSEPEVAIEWLPDTFKDYSGGSVTTVDCLYTAHCVATRHGRGDQRRDKNVRDRARSTQPILRREVPTQRVPWG